MTSPNEHLVLLGVRPFGGDPCHLHIRDGLISAIDNGIAPPERNAAAAATVADTTGLIVLPGLVDLHTHLREPGDELAETVTSGTRAAAAGGYTDVFAMANTIPVTDRPERVLKMRELADGTSARVHVVGSATLDQAGHELSPIDQMAELGVTLFSDDGRCLNDARLARNMLEHAARLGVTFAQHAQHGELAPDGQINDGRAAAHTGLPPWPGLAEATVVARDAVLAAETGGRLHICHVSTRRSVEIVRWAKDRGWPVTAEVTPHHLLLTDESALDAETRFKVNPPLRGSDDVTALRDGLLDGTIDAVATDHAPHTSAAKSGPWGEAAFGMTALETALPVTAHVLAAMDTLNWHLIADRMSARPARIGGIGTTAGRPLAVGEPANLTLVDTNAPWIVRPDEQYSRSVNTPFIGMEFTHRVVATFLEGQLTHGSVLPSLGARHD